MHLVVVVLVAALATEFVLGFALPESSLSQLVLVSAPLGLHLVSPLVHVDVWFILSLLWFIFQSKPFSKARSPNLLLTLSFCVPTVDTGFLFYQPTPLPLDPLPAPLPLNPLEPPDTLEPPLYPPKTPIKTLAPPLDPLAPPLDMAALPLPLDYVAPHLDPLSPSSLT
nr:hypothetical protein [Tanacetum cinerariifolium]